MNDRSESAPPGAAQSDSVRVSVHAPPQARVGDSVAIELRVTNVSGRAIELSLQGRDIAFDLSISSAGTLVWRRLEHETLQAILQLKTLAADETMVLRELWRPLRPGEYEIRGEVLTDAQPLRSGVVRLRVQ